MVKNDIPPNKHRHVVLILKYENTVFNKYINAINIGKNLIIFNCILAQNKEICFCINYVH